MRLTIALVPVAFLALSCLAMLWNPLGRRSSAAPEIAEAATA
jgi:hypothetical protein